MADLLIKPLTGAGNTVTIQDQAGGAILTSENSGATLSNATLTSPTLVTPALGTPASGVMTNMTGTPSAINLANATFPAGKVINFECKNGGTTTSQAVTNSYTDSGKGTVTYDVVSQTSKIFVQWNCHFQIENDATEYRLIGALRSDVDNYASNVSEASGGGQPLAINYSSPQIYLWTQYTMPIIAWHDHNQVADTTISYKIYFRGAGNHYSWDTWGIAETSENVTFIEVEQ